MVGEVINNIINITIKHPKLLCVALEDNTDHFFCLAAVSFLGPIRSTRQFSFILNAMKEEDTISSL